MTFYLFCCIFFFSMACMARTAAPRGEYLCPHCKTTLKTSAKGNVYCPKSFTHNCPFKAYKAGSKPKVVVETIKRLPIHLRTNEQTDIINAAIEGKYNQLIIARAGTGKTTIGVELVSEWIKQERDCLCLAFTKKDVRALEAKIGTRNDVKIYTSNGAGTLIMGQYCTSKGGQLNFNEKLANDKLFAMFKEDGLIKQEGKETKWEIEYSTFSAVIEAVKYARTILPLRHPNVPKSSDYLELLDRFNIEYKQEEIQSIEHYSARLFKILSSLQTALDCGIDFANQLFLPVYHQIKPKRTFGRIFIDETQDQSYVTREIAMLFASPGTLFVAVGDDRQAIYEWRGADSNAVKEMYDLLSNRHKTKSFPLTYCQRCDVAIIELAQLIVPDIKAMPGKARGVIRELADEIALFEELFNNHKAGKKGGFVVCRTNAPGLSLCLNLIAAGIPAVLQKNNVIGQLCTLIDNLTDKEGSTPVVTLLELARVWVEEQLARAAKKRNAETATKIVQDKYECLVALCENKDVQTALDVKEKLTSMFPKKDEIPDPREIILIATVHGAKGNEAPLTYLLSPTSAKTKSSIFDAIWSSAIDRDNTLYVAITRAEHEICWVGPMPTLAPMAEDCDELYDEEE